MNASVKRIVRNVAGFLLVLLGIVSGFLPILQGWLFILIGIGLIDIPAKRRLHEWCKRFSWYRAISLRYMRFKRHMHKKREERRARRFAACETVRCAPGSEDAGRGMPGTPPG